MQTSMDRNLLLAYKLMQKLHEKIEAKIETNKQSLFFRQLKSKVQLTIRIY